MRQLQQSLEALLQNPKAVEFITAIADSDRNVYVQFTPIDDKVADRLRIPRGTLSGESTGDAYLTRPAEVTPAQRDRLIALGWAAESGGNFSRYWHPPLDLGVVAQAGIQALIDGYGSNPPPKLLIHGANRDF
jgi:hypothetical protein